MVHGIVLLSQGAPSTPAMCSRPALEASVLSHGAWWLGGGGLADSIALCQLVGAQTSRQVTGQPKAAGAPLTPPDQALYLALVRRVQGSLQLRLHEPGGVRIGSPGQTRPATRSVYGQLPTGAMK